MRARPNRWLSCAIAGALLLAGCGKSGQSGAVDTEGQDSDTETQADTGTGSDTGTGPTLAEVVESDCGLVVHQGDVAITSPASIAALAGVTRITGQLSVIGSGVSTLEGLESLRCVDGPVVVSENPDLVNLAGLDGLALVGSLLIKNENALVQVALPALERVQGALILEHLTEAPVLSFPALKVVDGDLSVISVSSFDLSGLSALEQVGGSLVLNALSHLTDLDWLAGLTHVGGSLDINANNTLASIEGLAGLTEINGSLEIRSLRKLASLKGLHNVAEVGGRVRLEGNIALENLDGLSSLQKIGGEPESAGFCLAECDRVVDIDGLHHLEEVTSGVFDISSNRMLRNLDGLCGLTHLGGKIWLSRNDSLERLDGLDNVTYVGGSEIRINDNPVLPRCEAQGFVEQMQNLGWSGFTQTIRDNDEGVCLEGSACGGDADTDTETDTETDSDAGPDTDTQCSGVPDFTPCESSTEPDRSFDICSSGACVSPGCGHAWCNAPGPHFPLGDTDQRACFDDTAVIACPTSGDSYYGQDAQHGWDATHDESERFALDLATSGEPVVQDKVTLLSWQRCAAVVTGDTCNGGQIEQFTWEEALALCDGLAWGGYDDWRLPDEWELQSIVDYGRHGPALETTVFDPAPPSPCWSSSTYAGDGTMAWAVYFVFGRVGYLPKSTEVHVRCVRGEPAPVAERFERIGGEEPAVVDHSTGLIWQGCPAGTSGPTCENGDEMSPLWEMALAYCEDLEWAGFHDWRLPNIKELRSVIDNRRAWPAMDPAAFPAAIPGFVVSSTAYEYDPSSPWSVNAASGFAGNPGSQSWLACVRDGS